MQLQQVRVEVIEDVSAAALQTAVNAFLAAQTDRVFVAIQYQVAVSETAAAQQPVHAAMIVYTE